MTPPPPTPLPPSSTPIKPPPMQSATSSTHSLQTNSFRSSKSTDSLDTNDCGHNNHSIDENSQRPTSRLFQSFQWSNVFNGRNSKSTSQLNLVNCDKLSTVSVPNRNSDAPPSPYDQLSKGLNYSASFSNLSHQTKKQTYTSLHTSLKIVFIHFFFT